MSNGRTGYAAEWFATGYRLLNESRSSDIDEDLKSTMRRQKNIAELTVWNN